MIKRFGIQCKFKKPIPIFKWTYEWYHYKWYDTKENRDKAFDTLSKKNKHKDWRKINR